MRKNIQSSFTRRIIVGGDRPPLSQILGQPARVGAKSPILNQLSLVAPQPYDLAKNVQLTLIGSPHALSNEPKMDIVRCL